MKQDEIESNRNGERLDEKEKALRLLESSERDAKIWGWGIGNSRKWVDGLDIYKGEDWREREGTKTRGRPEEVSQCFGWKPFKENGEKRTEKGSIKIVLVSASRPLYWVETGGSTDPGFVGLVGHEILFQLTIRKA